MHGNLVSLFKSFKNRGSFPYGFNRILVNGSDFQPWQHITGRNHTVMMNRQFIEHAAAGRKIPHPPPGGFLSGSSGMFHFTISFPFGQGSGRSHDSSFVFLFQIVQNFHSLQLLPREEGDTRLVLTASSHGHGIIRSETVEADVFEQKGRQYFQGHQR